MAAKNFTFKNKISQAGFVFLIFFNFLYAHPILLIQNVWDVNSSKFSVFVLSSDMANMLNTDYIDKTNIKKYQNSIFDYTKKHIIISSCNLIPEKISLFNDGGSIKENFDIKCNPSKKYKIDFNMFFKKGNFIIQQGILKIVGTKEKVLLFTPKNHIKTIELNIKSAPKFIDFIKLGIMHILTGYDHLTFLLMLMLPLIVASDSFFKSLIYIVEVATAFTISHSLTLSLSVFHIVNPPANLIEILIAFTIFLTAFNNLTHYVSFKKEWLLAFLFGFIHGFGFANALNELHLQIKDFVKLVFGFNLGVEAGQFLVVLSVLPLLYFMVKKFHKLYIILSIFGGIFGLLWMIDRISGIGFMPF